MSNTGGDRTDDSKRPIRAERAEAKAAGDAVITGPSGIDNQTRYQAQKTMDNQESPSEHEIKAVKPGETLAQYNERTKAIQDNRFEITGLDSGSQKTEKDYIPGYSRKEAEARRLQLLNKSTSWTSEELDFLTKMEHKIRGDDTPVKPAEATQPRTIEKQTPAFELSLEAERVKWLEWQTRLNGEIFKKLMQHTQGHSFAVGTQTMVDYRVTRDGSFDYAVSGNNGEHMQMVRRAIDETLRYHPELLRFPPGTTRAFIERKNIPFRVVPGAASFETGEVESEAYKK